MDMLTSETAWKQNRLSSRLLRQITRRNREDSQLHSFRHENLCQNKYECRLQESIKVKIHTINHATGITELPCRVASSIGITPGQGSLKSEGDLADSFKCVAPRIFSPHDSTNHRGNKQYFI